jgi:hypothetical protein
MHPRVVLGLLAVMAACSGERASAGSPLDRPPPGSHFKLKDTAHAKAPTFKSGRPIVGTTYFYWYDVYTGAHLRNPDGSDALTTHPPESAVADLSYKSPDWHYSQLRDMAEAGLDFFMPVFWGVPGQYDGWSFAGLPPLVQAHDRMQAEHNEDSTVPLPPPIGLFYDTSTLQVNVLPDGRRNVRIDLTTSEGREWFYATIRDFFSMIPPRKWARIDGRPIIFLYAAGFAEKIDDRLFDDARQRFRRDFATDFFLVRHVDWPGRADAWYRWGGALGLTLGDVAAGLGPGYDHSAVPGRQALVVPRRGGAFYREQWERLLRMQPSRRPWIVHVETWNEWHEGTDVARSRDWGVRYLEMTTRYARLFRGGTRVLPEGPYVNAEMVKWSAQSTGGLTIRPSGGDGYWEIATIDGRRCVTTVPGPDSGVPRFLYFDVDDSFMFDQIDSVAELNVVLRDDANDCDAIRVDYDNGDPAAGVFDGAFRPTRDIPLGKTGAWRMISVHLPDVRFCNRTNGADFRIAAVRGKQKLTVAEVMVRRLPGKLMPPASQPASM